MTYQPERQMSRNYCTKYPGLGLEKCAEPDIEQQLRDTLTEEEYKELITILTELLVDCAGLGFIYTIKDVFKLLKILFK